MLREKKLQELTKRFSVSYVSPNQIRRAIERCNHHIMQQRTQCHDNLKSKGWNSTNLSLQHVNQKAMSIFVQYTNALNCESSNSPSIVLCKHSLKTLYFSSTQHMRSIWFCTAFTYYLNSSAYDVKIFARRILILYHLSIVSAGY